MSIFSWLEKLLAGDQNAAPAQASVERDAQGRIVEVSQTLSSGRSTPDLHPKLIVGEDLGARLSGACGALKITDQLINWGKGFVWPVAPWFDAATPACDQS